MLKKHGYSSNEIKKLLETFIHGIEIDAENYKNVISNLNKVLVEYKLSIRVNWDITLGDATEIDKFNGKMDFVVGNPPYIRNHDMNFDYKKFSFAKSMTDLYIIFFEIGINMLNRSGKLVYITPNSYLTSKSGLPLRQKMIEGNMIEAVLDLGHFNPFKTVTTYPIITILKNNKRNHRVDIYKLQDFKSRKINSLEDNSFYINDQFYFTSEYSLTKLKAILECESNNYVFDVKNGLATNADAVYYSNDFDANNSIVIPAYKASTGKYTKLIYPYNKLGRPISESELKKNKEIYKYLLSNKDILLDRSLQKNTNWYEFARSQALLDVYKKKIAINTIIRSVDTLKISMLDSGTAIYSGLYILCNDERNFKKIFNILRSNEFIDYVKALNKDKNGLYFYITSTDVKKYINYHLPKTIDAKNEANCKKTIVKDVKNHERLL
jgi:adenine-specific DNA-methyltransferase